MKTIQGWITFSWIALIGVMAGGALMLRRLAAGGATHNQLEWVRDGHAHGGLLILMSMLYFSFMDRTSLPNWMKSLAGLILFIGIAGQAGGFFVHGFAPSMAKAATTATIGGAILLTLAIIVLIFGLMRTNIRAS